MISKCRARAERSSFATHRVALLVLLVGSPALADSITLLPVGMGEIDPKLITLGFRQ